MGKHPVFHNTHLTAIWRNKFSLPIRCALEDKVITHQTTVLDYGCGKGNDVRRLECMGIDVTGWDPYYERYVNKWPADVVNLGYVVNVLPDIRDRSHVIKEAFELADSVLIITVRVGKPRYKRPKRFLDGWITSRPTFQKFYTQDEIVEFILDSIGQNVTVKRRERGMYYVLQNGAEITIRR